MKIRLKRCGRKKQPHYRIIAIDSKKRRDGRAIAELGFYNPISKETRIDLHSFITYIERGAQPTEKVVNLLNKMK